MKEVNLKKLPGAIYKTLGLIGSKINLNTWCFTLVFFFCVLGVSIWVWWNCLQNPLPSNEVLIRIEQGKVNYNEMKTSTEQVIATLQESREKFENPPFFGNQRELFLDVDNKNLKSGETEMSPEKKEPLSEELEIAEPRSLIEELGIEQGPEPDNSP